MSDTENPKCHSLSKNEGLTNGGNNVSSNVSEEMTEVCCVRGYMVLLETCTHQCAAKCTNLNRWLKKKKKLIYDTLIIWFICIESFSNLSQH